MSTLTVDAVSQKTLPHLDQLFRNNDVDKLTDILMSTPSEPLRRLILAAVARNQHLGMQQELHSLHASFLEKLITLNLAGKGDQVEYLIDTVGPDAQVMLMVYAIARFNIYESN